jgi:HEAT repeat protein
MSEKIPFPTVLNALTNTAANFPARFLPEFSDLAPANVAALLKVWPQVPPNRKRNLLRDLNELYRNETLYSFVELALALLDEPDPLTRAQVLRLLAETEDPRLLPRLVQFAASDPDVGCRTEAAAILGNYVRLGELENIPAEDKLQVEETLLAAAREAKNAHLQRAALEALGYSSRPEVPGLIEAAFNHPDTHWTTSALIAMLHSTDQRWNEQILVALDHEDGQVRLIATQAAGELELKNARQKLLAMLDDEDDDEVYEAIIWSLSQIGGEDVRDYLQALLDAAEDDETVEFLEDALTNLSFTEDLENFDLMAYDADDELVDEDDLDDLEDEAER